MATVQSTIEHKLKEVFSPEVLSVINESSSHNVPANSETHFKLLVVSKVFEAKRVVARHQMVYGALAEELSAGVHALSMRLVTPCEWAKDSSVEDSPPCLGG